MMHWSTWVSLAVIISARSLKNLSPTCLKSLHLAVILIRAYLEASLYNANLTVQDAQILGPSLKANENLMKWNLFLGLGLEL